MQDKNTKKTFIPLLLVTLAVLFSLASCEEPDYPEVMAAPITLDVERWDGVLSNSDANALDIQRELSSTLPSFYRLYHNQILGLGSLDNDSAATSLQAFMDYGLTKETQQSLDKAFAGEELNERFEAAFARYHTLFPEKLVPHLVMMNTGFNYGIYPTDSVLGIGLEFYLGEKDTVIQRLPNEQFPAYMREKMRPELVVPNAMKGWLLVHFQDKANGTDLLDQMVYQGKIHYMLHLILPDEPDHLLYAYSENEWKWCQTNEFNIWQALVKEDLLFSKDKMLIRNWTGNGPFTRGFGEESPAPLAPFLGERIVKDYMDKHTDQTVQQLLDTDAKEILRSYTPDS